MDSYRVFLEHLAQSPNDKYRDDMQQRVIRNFDNTTRQEGIVEENIPFDFKFEQGYQVIVDSVSEQLTNLTKIAGDYKQFQYIDCKHKTYRGQHILYDDDYYLVYDKTSDLSTVAKTKAIKCNNKIRWYDSNGVIREYPCFIGNDLSSTNNQISKDGATPNGRLICMIQGNEFTHEIILNQRFVLSHKQVFKVEEFDAYVMSDYNTEEVPIIKLFINWVSENGDDDLENNISRNGYGYSLQSTLSEIIQPKGHKGKLEIIAERDEEVIETELIYESSDESIIKVDEFGNYEIVGILGDKAFVKVFIKGNESVFVNINIEVVTAEYEEDEIIISPTFDSINTFDTIIFNADLYKNGVKTSDIVTYIASGADISNYVLQDTINLNEFSLECKEYDEIPLTLTFESGIVTKSIDIQLKKFI